MLRFVVLTTAATAAMIAASPADAQRGWRTVAHKTVSGGVDTDRINVPGGQRWREVRLCVFNAPLRMRDFDIRFDNGQHQDVKVRRRIAASTCTRNVDLPGNRRDIRWIRLRYEPIARRYTRPLVRVQVR